MRLHVLVAFLVCDLTMRSGSRVRLPRRSHGTMRLNTSSGIGTGRMDRSSCDVCALWAFAIGRSPRDHPGKTLTLRDSLARSAGSAWTTSSCSVKRTCAGSSAPMLSTIMSRGPIDLWPRTPVPSRHSAPRRHHITTCPRRTSSPILQNLIFGTHTHVSAYKAAQGQGKPSFNPFARKT